MKILLIFTLILVSSSSHSVRGIGGGGGPSAHFAIEEILSIETIDREIYSRNEFLKNYNLKDTLIFDSTNILNIELNSGEILIP